VARPDSSDKTLLDLQPGSLRVALSHDDLLIALSHASSLLPDAEGSHEFDRAAWAELRRESH
jgi:hypothetical protein